jgi:hypothetical protein
MDTFIPHTAKQKEQLLMAKKISQDMRKATDRRSRKHHKP